MGERFDIQVNSQAGTTTLCLSGQIDIAAGRAVRGAVADATFGCRPQTLIVDLTDTTFLDSSAITALILARHLAQHVGAAFELIGTPATTRTIQISGLYDFLHAQRERPELPVAG